MHQWGGAEEKGAQARVPAPPGRPPLHSVLLNAWRCRCPRCWQGPLFRAWPHQVLPRCPVCGLSYFREPGYYVGGLVGNDNKAMGVNLVVSQVLLILMTDTGWQTGIQ